VQNFPKTEPLSEDTDLSGHVWVQELFTGEPLCFRIAGSGFIEFGTRGGKFNGDIPLPFRRGARCIREGIDRSALRGSVEDTESVTFFGTATLYKGLGYDWSELPAFVGVDVWSDEKGSYLTPDAASSAYGSLGLAPLPAFQKETDAGRVGVDRYASGDLPESRFKDATAAGVLIRDKSGRRGAVRQDVTDDAGERSPEEVVSRYVTGNRVQKVAKEAGTSDEGIEEILDRLTEAVVRERYASLYGGRDSVTDEREVRSMVAERVRRHV
jgi:hypothetical protein